MEHIQIDAIAKVNMDLNKNVYKANSFIVAKFLNFVVELELKAVIIQHLFRFLQQDTIIW